MESLENVWKKRSTIYRAITTYPKDEKDWPDWYKARMDKCRKCPHNTNNMKNEDIDNTFLWALKKIGNKLGKKPENCNFCGCFIPAKCWEPDEVCGKVEKGLTPEWGAISIFAGSEDEFDVEVLTPGVTVTTSQSNGGFTFNLMDLEDGTIKRLKFALVSHKPIYVVSKGSSCGCTTMETNSSEDWKRTTIDVDINVSHAMPGGGSFTKSGHIMYCDPADKELDFENNQNAEKRFFLSFKFIGRNRLSYKRELELAKQYIQSIADGVVYDSDIQIRNKFGGLSKKELTDIYVSSNS
ncbi:hypothetical protein [Parabacteroides goldsteinii]|uniref:hypothetical protein n=1 Tax=Parabacteroides goldsteinii TaxID=328812 RepID=UPI00256EBC00|nr:hypothetical protein [Parabacteroides goldsteinii]